VIDYFIDHQEQHGFSAWLVEEKASGAVIGHCGLVHILGQEEVELIYALGKNHWSKGYATDAAQAVLDYAFDTLQLNHVIALAMPQNSASQRVMQKIGMVYQGISSDYYNTELVVYAQQQRDLEAYPESDALTVFG
jgi:RimJ/RimL family protein N-acetyltransferase